MKSQAARIILVIFAALVIACAFEGQEAQASTTLLLKKDGAFCSIQGVTSVEVSPCTQPVLRGPMGKALGPLVGIHPRWSLAYSIDHPPERSSWSAPMLVERLDTAPDFSWDEPLFSIQMEDVP